MARLRPVRIIGEVAFVTLSGGHEAVIDAADAPAVARHNWSAFDRGRGRVYARRYEVIDGKSKCVMLHRFILAPAAGADVDHINGDTLDNRRSNLREATRSENLRNGRAKSGYKGVSRLKFETPRPWQARIYVDGRNHHLGTFATQEEAALAYNQAAAEAYGEFARLNVVSEAKR